MTETTPDYAGLTPGERLIESAREAVAAAKGEPSENPSIWHYMDEKTVAAYGPWVRHADFKEALRTLLESNAALERERDEEKAARDRWFQTHVAHRKACEELGKANGEMFKRAVEAERRAETAEAQLAALTGPEGDMRDYHDGIVATLMSRAEAAEAKLAEAMKVIGQIDNALNDQFAAGIEEREGGSARRQERLMKSGEELRRAARKLLKENGNGE